jgi:hypothetical protein
VDHFCCVPLSINPLASAQGTEKEIHRFRGLRGFREVVHGLLDHDDSRWATGGLKLGEHLGKQLPRLCQSDGYEAKTLILESFDTSNSAV